MKHPTLTRLLALLLALVMMVGMVSMIACADENPPDDTPGTDDPDQTPEEGGDQKDDNLPDTDDLPATLNYDGYEFRICTRERTFFHSNWLTDDFDGSRINDAIFSRQSEVAQRLGVTFVETLVQDTEPARISVAAGTDEFDLINARCASAWSYAEQGLVVPVSELEYINTEKSYWDDNLNAAMTVAGQMYFATGASNITAYDLTHALLFNKQMIADYGLELPYALVENGEWTLEAFAEMTADVTSESDGASDESVYGYLSQPKQVLPGFWIGAGILSIAKNEDDIPEFTLPGDDKFVDLFDTVYEMTYDSGAWFPNQSRDNSDPVLLDMFQTDRGLFYSTSFFYVESLRNMVTDFGILPYPKYDDDQTEYYSRIEGCELSCVPVTTTDKARTSAVLEALASSSATTVETAYYDIVLKKQAARDEDSSAMLDIIFANRVFDMGDTIWCDLLRDGVFEGMFMNGDRNLASKLESVTTSLGAKIEESVNNFLEKN